MNHPAGRWYRFLQAAGRFGHAVETGLLVLILGSMILLAFGQIVMRNFFDLGLQWGDELLRMLVLWVAVAGAVAASRNDKHINIAVLDRFLPDPVQRVVKVLVYGVTAAICAIVAWYSLQFVLTSREFDDRILGDVPAWWLQMVLPVGFGLITWRYGLFFLRDVAKLVMRKPTA